MNITLPLRYDDGQLLDLDFDDQDKVIEKNGTFTNAAHVIGTLIARQLLNLHTAEALMTKKL